MPAVCYLGSLIQMLSLPDIDQTNVMVSSLWIVEIYLGRYMGSSIGGMAFDNLGFEVGSLSVILGL